MSTPTARSFLPLASTAFGVSPSAMGVIDRALAMGGLRRLGKGRSWPALTRDEAIVFLLACMVTQKHTRAAEDVGPWLRISVPVDSPDYRIRAGARLLGTPLELSGEGSSERLLLPEALRAICTQLESGALRAEDIELWLDLALHVAVLSLGPDAEDRLTFRPETPEAPLPASAIQLSSRITGAALKVITMCIPAESARDD